MASLQNNFLDFWWLFAQPQRRADVQYFERHREDFIYKLHKDLLTDQYQHDGYAHFYTFDPQKRFLSKACVRDRLVHQMLYADLAMVFEKSFIFHSFSCRVGKGTHQAIGYLHKSLRQVSRNGKRPCFVLKMDIRRFFDSVDHQILKQLIAKRVKDRRVLHLIDLVINSFTSSEAPESAVGLPLGNVTSQLFANIYLHELDNFVKQTLRQKHYLRYCDDFVIVAPQREELEALIQPIETFLQERLRLTLHPKKIILRELRQGIDYLGYVLFRKHRLLRTRTKRRMKRRLKKRYADYLSRRISQGQMDQSLQSYLGILAHANTYRLAQSLKNAYWLRSAE